MYRDRIRAIYALKRKAISGALLIAISSLLLFTFVSSILAFEEPVFFPLEISSLRLYGENQVEMSDFERGEMVSVEIKIQKPLKYVLISGQNNSVHPSNVINYDLIITIIYEENILINSKNISKSINLDDVQTINTSFQVQDDAELGSYVVSVMARGDEGVPLFSEIAEVNFNVYARRQDPTFFSIPWIIIDACIIILAIGLVYYFREKGIFE